MKNLLAPCESQPGFSQSRVSLFFVHFGNNAYDLPVDTSPDIGRVEAIGLRGADEEPYTIINIREIAGGILCSKLKKR